MNVAEYEQEGDGVTFDELLQAAELNANNEWEKGFVSDFRERYNRYAEDTLVSDRQIDILNRIAFGGK